MNLILIKLSKKFKFKLTFIFIYLIILIRLFNIFIFKFNFMLIDTHAHINFKDFKIDAEETIQRALDKNIWMIIVGSEYKTSQRSIKYANKYEKGIYSAIGLHPVHLEDIKIENKSKDNSYSFYSRAEEFNYDLYKKLATFEKVIAIGEIGLDYFHIDSKNDILKVKKKQQDVFRQQLELAIKSNLPVIIHCREAHEDLINILKSFKKEYKNFLPKDKPWGVVHCFSGDEDLAWQYFSLGLIISFNGLITFSKTWDDLIRKMPLEKFIIETDCPYLTPEPYRGKRNEPLFVQYVANRIAEIKKLDIKKIAEVSTNNARNLFNV